MKKMILILCVGFLTGCATPTPIPQEVKDKAALIPASDLPQNSHLEKRQCSKRRYHSFEKRMECKETVRRELAARQIMREQNEQ